MERAMGPACEGVAKGSGTKKHVVSPRTVKPGIARPDSLRKRVSQNPIPPISTSKFRRHSRTGRPPWRESIPLPLRVESRPRRNAAWIPAYAGMTAVVVKSMSPGLLRHPRKQGSIGRQQYLFAWLSMDPCFRKDDALALVVGLSTARILLQHPPARG